MHYVVILKNHVFQLKIEKIEENEKANIILLH